jgi:Fe2+ transport system protein B
MLNALKDLKWNHGLPAQTDDEFEYIKHAISKQKRLNELAETANGDPNMRLSVMRELEVEDTLLKVKMQDKLLNGRIEQLEKHLRVKHGEREKVMQKRIQEFEQLRMAEFERVRRDLERKQQRGKISGFLLLVIIVDFILMKFSGFSFGFDCGKGAFAEWRKQPIR